MFVRNKKMIKVRIVHILISILILALGFFANLKIMDVTAFQDEELIELRIKEKYSKVIIGAYLSLYLLGAASLIFSNLDSNSMILAAMFFNMLSVIGLTDYLTFYIYDNVLLGYGVILFILKFALGKMNFLESLFLLLIGGAIYGIIYLIARLIYKREAFGLGDVYLIAMISAMMSYRTILVALFSPFYIAPVFLLLKFIVDRSSKHLKLKSEIPFGPYICLGAWVTYLYGDVLVDLYLKLAGY